MMNGTSKLMPTIVMMMAISSIVTVADTYKCNKIFLKKLKTSCSLTGISRSTKFTMKHTQNEWEEIKQAGQFAEEVRKVCPNLPTKLDFQYENDLYNFAYEYASDSGNIPRC